MSLEKKIQREIKEEPVVVQMHDNTVNELNKGN